MRRPHAVVAALLAGAALAGCGGAQPPLPAAPAFADPGRVEVAGWRMHYALTATEDLPETMSASYGIPRSPDRALLVVALEPPSPAPPTADATVEATAVALTGGREPLVLARHDEAGRPTWVAAVAIRHRVPITIEIRAHATRAGPALTARLTRELRIE